MDVSFHKLFTVLLNCYIKGIIPFLTPVEYLILPETNHNFQCLLEPKKQTKDLESNLKMYLVLKDLKITAVV